jgi:hypothetical protein
MNKIHVFIIYLIFIYMYANVVYTDSRNVRTSTFKATSRRNTYIRRALQHGTLNSNLNTNVEECPHATATLLMRIYSIHRLKEHANIDDHDDFENKVHIRRALHMNCYRAEEERARMQITRTHREPFAR